jgi:hypothetical protein
MAFFAVIYLCIFTFKFFFVQGFNASDYIFINEPDFLKDYFNVDILDWTDEQRIMDNQLERKQLEESRLFNLKLEEEEEAAKAKDLERRETFWIQGFSLSVIFLMWWF